MSSKQKMRYCIPVLYNIVFDGEECFTSPCQKGKCICLDTEQEGLLRKLLFKKDMFVMEFAEDNINILSIPTWPLDKVDYIENNTGFTKGYFCSEKKIEDDKIKELLDEVSEVGAGIEEVIKDIPRIYSVNFLYDMKERNSILNLCVYSYSQDFYLMELFKAVICKTIMYCEKVSKTELRKYSEAYAQMIKKLNAMFKTRKNEEKDMVHSIEEYSRAWYKKEANAVWETRNIGNILEDYRLEILDDTSIDFKGDGLYGAYNYGKLYDISKKILETAGVSEVVFPKLVFADTKEESEEWDEVLRILDEVKGDKEKLHSVWRLLYNIFINDIDISAEDLDEIKQVVE